MCRGWHTIFPETFTARCLARATSDARQRPLPSLAAALSRRRTACWTQILPSQTTHHQTAKTKKENALEPDASSAHMPALHANHKPRHMLHPLPIFSDCERKRARPTDLVFRPPSRISFGEPLKAKRGSKSKSHFRMQTSTHRTSTATTTYGSRLNHATHGVHPSNPGCFFAVPVQSRSREDAKLELLTLSVSCTASISSSLCGHSRPRRMRPSGRHPQQPSSVLSPTS